jgi:hypothetical protein
MAADSHYAETTALQRGLHLGQRVAADAHFAGVRLLRLRVDVEIHTHARALDFSIRGVLKVEEQLVTVERCHGFQHTHAMRREGGAPVDRELSEGQVQADDGLQALGLLDDWANFVAVKDERSRWWGAVVRCQLHSERRTRSGSPSAARHAAS